MLGATDGIVSTSAVAVAIAAVATTRDPILLATVAAALAGAASMAASEYVSVASARDAQQADLEEEREQHAERPEREQRELATMFEARGASPETAEAIAAELSERDALAAHAREELGLTDELAARPLQTSATSGVAFLAGSSIPIVAIRLAPLGMMLPSIAAATLVALIGLGIARATIGGAGRRRAVLRIVVGAGLAMTITVIGSGLLGIEL